MGSLDTKPGGFAVVILGVIAMGWMGYSTLQDRVASNCRVELVEHPTQGKHVEYVSRTGLPVANVVQGRHAP